MVLVSLIRKDLNEYQMRKIKVSLKLKLPYKCNILLIRNWSCSLVLFFPLFEVLSLFKLHNRIVCLPFYKIIFTWYPNGFYFSEHITSQIWLLFNDYECLLKTQIRPTITIHSISYSVFLIFLCLLILLVYFGHLPLFLNPHIQKKLISPFQNNYPNFYRSIAGQ